MNGVIITIGVIAVGCMVVEKIAVFTGHMEIGQLASLAGYSLAGISALGLVGKLLGTLKTLAG